MKPACILRIVCIWLGALFLAHGLGAGEPAPVRGVREISRSGRTYLVMTASDGGVMWELVARRDGAPPLAAVGPPDRPSKGSRADPSRDPADMLLSSGKGSLPWGGIARVLDRPPSVAVFGEWVNRADDTALVVLGKDGQVGPARTLGEFLTIDEIERRTRIGPRDGPWLRAAFADEERGMVTLVSADDRLFEVSLADGAVTKPNATVLFSAFSAPEADRCLALEIAARLRPAGLRERAEAIAADPSQTLATRVRAAVAARAGGSPNDFSSIFRLAMSAATPVRERIWAFQNVVRVFGKDAIPLLREASHGPFPGGTVQYAAHRAWAELRAEAVPVLVDMLNAPGESKVCRSVAANSLLAIGVPDAIEALYAAMESSSPGADAAFFVIKQCSPRPSGIEKRLAAILERGSVLDDFIIQGFMHDPFAGARAALQRVFERELRSFVRKNAALALDALDKLEGRAFVDRSHPPEQPERRAWRFISSGPGGIRIGISETGRLVELWYERFQRNFASTNAPALWSLQLVSGATTNALDASKAANFECRTIDNDPRGLRLAWSGFDAAGAPGMRVEIIVRLDPDEPVGRWELSVLKPRDSAIEEVRFPRLSGIPTQVDEVLAVPAWMGQMLPDPRAALAGSKGQGARYSWEYPGTLSLQCLAFYRQNGAGLYLACDDLAAFRKSFAVRGDGKGGIEFEISHLPENGARGVERYTPGYGVIIGTFFGDWITAAERYRAWAKGQPWAKDSRLASGLVPDWAMNTALWVWNRGRSPGVLGPAVALQRELGLPVSVLWHWWHGCSYDAGFPEYLPPREGAEAFRAALTQAHDNDVHALVYMNQRLWGLTTKSWRDEGAERFAVRGPNGAYREEVYNTFTKQPCVSMCMGTAFWRNKYAGLAERAIKELGVDGIYMDQACSSLACFDPAHGHPLGGGTYWMNGFRQLSGDIRERCQAARPIALAGEGCGEPWLPYLDLMLSLEVSRERYMTPTVGWETIPFFQAVYHPNSIQFGNYSSLTMPPYDDLWPEQFLPKEPLRLLDRKYSRQFYLEQARAFAWGQQPTIANFQPSHLRDRPDEVAYALRLARIRHRGLKYLLHGEFLRPPELGAPEIAADMSRLSIYAGQRGGLTEFRKHIPSVVAGAWRSPDGDLAIALASVVDEPLRLDLNLHAEDGGAWRIDQADRYHDLYRTKATPQAQRVWRIDESGRAPLGRGVQGQPMKVDLAPRGACLIELTDD